VRIDRLDIAAFGSLRGFTATDLGRTDVLVLLGPNESGKSTVAEFVTTILFGFSPATREQHPYAPWDGAVAEGSAMFSFADGRTATVHRRLMSAPQGLVRVGEDTRKLANGPVPWVGTVTRDMYGSLFALTAEQALELRQSTWSQVEDRLLGGASYSFLRPAREVDDALQKRADRLWRSDRRGKPLARSLRERLKQLKKERTEALTRAERVLQLNAALADIEHHITSATGERREAARRLRQAEVLLPVHRVLQRIEALRERAGRVLADVTLPPDPGEALEERRRELAALRRERDDQRANLDATRRRAELSDAHASLVDAELSISSLVQQVEAHHGETSRVDALTDEADALQSELDAERQRSSEPTGALRTAAPGLAAALALGALAAGAAGIATDRAWLAILTGVLAAAAGGLFAWSRAPLPPIDDTTRRDLDRVRRRLDEAARQVDARSSAAASLLEALGRDSSGDAMDAVPALQRDLRDALVEGRRSDEARRAIPEQGEQLQRLEASIVQAEQDLGELEASLAALDPRAASAEAGLALHEEARRWQDEANALEQNLHEQTPLWEDYAAEAHDLVEAGVELHVESGELEALRERVKELELQVQTLNEKRGESRQERDDLMTRPGVDHVDGEMEVLQETLGDVSRQRDRLVVLRSVVRLADRRFREEHQPPVLRAASRYASVVTGGRYTSLSSADEGAGGTLAVTTNDSPYPQPLQHPLSRGTRQQLYLAVRLALVEHIDGAEPLPLMLDEMFVNWDPTRTSAGLDILQEVGRRRQVLLMTCQPGFAETVREAVGAKVIDLGAPRT